MLERDGMTRGDRTLAWLARLQSLVETAAMSQKKSRRDRNAGVELWNDTPVEDVVDDLEARLRTWQGAMTMTEPSSESAADDDPNDVLTLASLFAHLTILGGPLLAFERPSQPVFVSSRSSPALSSQASSCAGAMVSPLHRNLWRAIPKLRAYFDLVLSKKLPARRQHHVDAHGDAEEHQRGGATTGPTTAAAVSPFLGFNSIDWARFVLCVILGIRMSFDLPSAETSPATPMTGPSTSSTSSSAFPSTPSGSSGSIDTNEEQSQHPQQQQLLQQWDAAAARRALRFGDILDRMCGGPPGDLDDDSQDCNDHFSTEPTVTASSNAVPAAMRAVLCVVRLKYRRRVRFEETDPEAQLQLPSDDAHHGRKRRRLDRSMQGCPMIDMQLAGGGGGLPFKDMDTAMDVNVDMTAIGGNVSMGGHGSLTLLPPSWDGRTVYHDLWATMSACWAADATGTGR